MTASTAGVGQGGVSLGGLGINDISKTASFSQSDRLKRYVEGETSAGFRQGPPTTKGGKEDDDVRSVSTSFASQIDAGGYD